MKRFILLLMIVFIGYVSKPLWEEPVQQFVSSYVMDPIQSTVDWAQDNPDIDAAIDSLNQQLNSLFATIDDLTTESESNDTDVETPELTDPTDQIFSVHNIEIGDSRAEVEQETGEPQRTSENEYGVDWETYHENYQNFIMVAYDEEDTARGLYTNQDLIASPTGIEIGSSKESVSEHLGTPESAMRKGLVNYQINDNGEYDVFQTDNNYVTMFYDKHENDTVTAIQVIDEELEQNKNAFYTEPSEQLQAGLEYQLFDLTNATRAKHDLPILTWDDQVRETAQDHSSDMAENQYFNHVNLEGQSPFDRMEEDDISFTTAGENLAYGQYSSIFAHEGLMNSLGHRENILKENYRNLGVGVAFNDESQPYYTEKFYSDSLAL
ncbi:CAP domain-containing protein [Virgibacillus sp. CBA3643]|uniref:CAP domain-containing protein n=1 Tax=Virgibacillus sp. CBA3643 TaxID=2942278 RepID=UPI0035A34E2A